MWTLKCFPKRKKLNESANNDIVLQNYGTSSVSLDKLGLSELTPGPVTWNVEVFVQVLKELVSAGTTQTLFMGGFRGARGLHLPFFLDIF